MITLSNASVIITDLDYLCEFKKIKSNCQTQFGIMFECCEPFIDIIHFYVVFLMLILRIVWSVLNDSSDIDSFLMLVFDAYNANELIK